MQAHSLPRLVESELGAAREASSGRAAVTVFGGHEHDMRQTLIALAEGRSLGEHESPTEATLQVLHGRVAVTAGDDSWQGQPGDHLVIPASRHDLTAITDAAVLLTVATRA